MDTEGGMNQHGLMVLLAAHDHAHAVAEIENMRALQAGRLLAAGFASFYFVNSDKCGGEACLEGVDGFGLKRHQRIELSVFDFVAHDSDWIEDGGVLFFASEALQGVEVAAFVFAPGFEFGDVGGDEAFGGGRADAVAAHPDLLFLGKRRFDHVPGGGVDEQGAVNHVGVGKALAAEEFARGEHAHPDVHNDVTGDGGELAFEFHAVLAEEGGDAAGAL